MIQKEPAKKADLFIVDNSDSEWKVQKYLSEWCDISTSFDIATGSFEIGSLLSLDHKWQNLEKIRILMGDEVTKRTQKALLLGTVKQRLDSSIEATKENNDFLSGVPAIVEALRTKQIECKVYNKEKFHAKAYITHAIKEVVGSSALVGSSNFTYPGITTNVELNIQIRREVEELQAWFERHWNEAENISDEVLKVIERHVHEYSPFEVYAKALQEFFKGHELTVGEWELTKSRIYPELDRYQQEGYRSLMKIAQQYGGAFLCDGVGLGKTLIGLMVIERLCMFDRKRVALFVPKAAREPVWKKHLRKYAPHLFGDFTNLAVYNHSDLSRGADFPEKLRRIAEQADVIVIDEAHHFRNPGIKGEKATKPSRYRKMIELCEGKPVFLLTATPINNKLIDLQHMIELFTPKRSDGTPQADYFKTAPLGIHSLPGHFRKMENALKKMLGEKESDPTTSETNQAEAERILKDDSLFRALVVQRSRSYVRKSQEQHGESTAMFPLREKPRVVNYSIKKTYGRLLEMIETAFMKEAPLFTLAIYYPLNYYKGPEGDEKEMKWEENRQKQLVALIRTQFLKRFESSVKAFEISCALLLQKLLAFQTANSTTTAEKQRLKKWLGKYAEVVEYSHETLKTFVGKPEESEVEEDFIPEEMVSEIEPLDRDLYRVEDILADNDDDLDQLLDFFEETRKFKPSHDNKLSALKRLLTTEPRLLESKVLIFTEFMHTARYLKKELEKAGIENVDEVDSSDGRDRGEVLSRFAPYYNESVQGVFSGMKGAETRILISTDVLSEGLNLQDATFVINYDLHWNPVRLMQRIGRVDRRMDPEIEKRMLADYPERKDLRGKIAFWNFLPPEELDEILRLYSRVSHKTLRISKVFGIEGRKLLKPDDDYEALKDFTHAYEGQTTSLEEMHLEYQRLLTECPDLENRLNGLPGRVFSGKKHPEPGTKAVFFCYGLPASRETVRSDGSKETTWSEEAGHTKWYLYDISSEKIVDDPAEIVKAIRSEPTTPRFRSIEDITLSEIRLRVEKHINNTYFKQVQAPMGVKGKLKAWMELS